MGQDDIAGLNAGNAGLANGAVAFSFTSNGTDVGSANLQLTGTVYAEASGSATAPDPVTLHVGGDGSESFQVANTAPAPYAEKLKTDVAGTTAGVTVGNTPGLIAAGNSDTLNYTIDTSNAGSIDATVSLQYSSDGTGLDKAAPIVVGQQDINIDATVYNYAIAALSSDGDLSGSGTSYTLNLGSAEQGDDPLTASLSVLNGTPTGPVT